MGLKITELLPKREITLDELNGKTIAIDASNHLYQFLTTIRGPDGALFTDRKGRVTSHLIGLFSRTSYLLQKNITPVYVFDGKPPVLKKKTFAQRKAVKTKAGRMYEKATEKGEEEEMKKYAARTSRLTPEMVEDAKELLKALGVPVFQAPSEGEAQAAGIVRDGNAFAVSSQDADSLVFGSDRLIRNLSVSGRRQARGIAGEQIPPEVIVLKEFLENCGITQEQLIILSILIGTDYNPGGIRGIGPVKALDLVKANKDFDKLFEELKWADYFDFPWREVYNTIREMPASPSKKFKSEPFSKSAVKSLLCESHGFSETRVESTLKKLEAHNKNRAQKGLGGFI
ncbi:flap endonuclease-1 [Candidatus Woesearchaeota archaeon]|nr:flap endonuclease-1 [Candidatus Woesearchaeota archaeon]